MLWDQRESKCKRSVISIKENHICIENKRWRDYNKIVVMAFFGMFLWDIFAFFKPLCIVFCLFIFYHEHVLL